MAFRIADAPKLRVKIGDHSFTLTDRATINQVHEIGASVDSTGVAWDRLETYLHHCHEPDD